MASVGRAPTVLLAEGDPEIRSRLVHGMRRDGYDVIEAKDGDLAIRDLEGALLDGRPLPSAIVADVSTARTSGTQILDGVREAGWRIPVILIAGEEDASLRERASAAAIFAPGFDPDDLRTVLVNIATLVPAPGHSL